VLGASAGSKPEPDFPHLGIELKTLPITREGKPLETTFVCVTPLKDLVGATWQNSHIKNKLARVLWVPIIAERSIAIPDRIIGTPFIWSPSPEEEHLMAMDWQELTDMIVLGEVENITGKHGQVLQIRPKAAMDWQELTDMIVLGEVENITGKHGQVLQIRPKAANSQAKTQAVNKNGQPFMTLPRGFYLKTTFTHHLLKKHLRIN